MSTGTTLDDIVNGCSQLTDASAIKAYFASVVAAQQKELQKTKAVVEDFRAVHNFENLYEKNASINALIDPVVNSEILHLKQLLHVKDEELRASHESKECQKYNPQSAIGKALLDRCKLLITENEELGRIVLESQVQPLTLDLYKEREATKVLKNQLKWLHQYNAELEEENEILSKKWTQQSQELTELQREKDALEQKLLELQNDYDLLISKKPGSTLLMPEAISHKEDKSRHDHKPGKDDKLRRDDRLDYDKRDSKYGISRKDEMRDSEKRGERHESTKRTSKSEAEKKIDKYESKKDDRHLSSRKDEKSRRDDSYPRGSSKRLRDDPRDKRSPYRSRRSRSPRSSRKY